MDNNTQTSGGNPEAKGSLGPIIGTIIILIVLAIGGLYIWGGKIKDEQKKQDTGDEITTIDSEANAIDLDTGLDAIDYSTE